MLFLRSPAVVGSLIWASSAAWVNLNFVNNVQLPSWAFIGLAAVASVATALHFLDDVGFGLWAVLPVIVCGLFGAPFAAIHFIAWIAAGAERGGLISLSYLALYGPALVITFGRRDA